MAAISIEKITKRYSERVVVDSLSFEVPRGSIAGFLGPNGAGKTTTMRMIMGLIKPTSGSGRILGQVIENPVSYMGKVGAIIDSPAFYPGLSVHRNLEVLAALGNIDRRRISRVLSQVGIADRAQSAYKTLSLGMRQRLAIAAALLREPLLLMLDEPTNGLDPAGIIEIRDLLRAIAADGQTVFVSSHLLFEIEHACDWLVMIDHGHEIFVGPTTQLLAGTQLKLFLRTAKREHMKHLWQLCKTTRLPIHVEGNRVVVTVDRNKANRIAKALNQASMQGGFALAEIEFGRTNLEDRFLSLTKTNRKS